MRRSLCAAWAFAVLGLAGCGRQVTGLNAPDGGVTPAGTTRLRIETAGPLDPRNVAYLIVFNTSGDGVQPYAAGYTSDFKEWSAYFILGGGKDFTSQPDLEQVYPDPLTGTPTHRPVGYVTNAAIASVSDTTASSAYSLEVTFNRCLLDLAPPSTTPPVPVTTNRDCPPFQTSGIATTWNVSFFTAVGSAAVDSLSATTSGPPASEQKFVVDTTQLNTGFHFTKPANGVTLQNLGAQITGVAVFNTP